MFQNYKLGENLPNEGFKTLAKTGHLAVFLGQWRHHLGVTGDKSGVDASVLDELANQLVEHAGIGLRGRALHVHLLQNALEEFVGLRGVELVTSRELLATCLLQSRHHFHSPPGRLPVHVVDFARLSVEYCLITTSNVLDQTGDEVLGQFHQVVHICVSLVELAGGELGVVSKVNSLIAKLFPNFESTPELAWEP